MAPETPAPWSTAFDTLRRERLFRNPPAAHSEHPILAEAFHPHIDSYNAVFERDGFLDRGIEDIGVKTFIDATAASESSPNHLRVRIQKWFFEKSQLPPKNKYSTTNRKIYPAECRERQSTYRGRFKVRLEYQLNNDDWKTMDRDLGYLPIMSSQCHLESAFPRELVIRGEESEECGGYFIVNGNEKVIRMLILQKRNWPLALERNSLMNRGPTYSKYAVSIRSVRPDQTSQTQFVHYLTDGNVTFRFYWRRNEYLVPVLLIVKALVQTNDRQIFESIVDIDTNQSIESKQFIIDRMEMLLRTFKVYNLYDREKTLAYLGHRFKPVLGIPSDTSDSDAGKYFLRKIVLPHLGNTDDEDNNRDKFHMIMFMIRKLYAFVEGECAADNPDAASNQELMLSGHFFGMVLKEKLEEYLNLIGTTCKDWLTRGRGDGSNRTWADPEFLQDFSKIMGRVNETIGGMMTNMLATGNITSPTGLDLSQSAGFSVTAEKINFYRFVSQFRAVHRGAFFTEVRTTAIRKLLPESWGFMCPVHTPDGAPCGLLNHLAHQCKVATRATSSSRVPEVLARLGLVSSNVRQVTQNFVVQLDGRILGFCTSDRGYEIAEELRRLKVNNSDEVPLDLEIGYIPPSRGGQYPGIYMSTSPARMYRPVKHLSTGKLDYVGPLEQPHMAIACTDEEVASGGFTHVEYDPTNILSIVANMTPFSDFNQSPRNMYQCQMGKQTMGTPTTAWKNRADNKMYRLQTGQTPIARPQLHQEYGLDNYPSGTNAIVAVISYTGYDMDDAMILSRGGHDRGFGNGCIYKTKIIDLEGGQQRSRTRNEIGLVFGIAPGSRMSPAVKARLDEDGLPFVGQMVQEGDIIAASHTVMYDPKVNDLVNFDGQTKLERYRDAELAFIEEVKLLGDEDGSRRMTCLSIKFRIPRSPVIGDKFSSRHGQKGVCSQKWPTIDMPFSESGIVPDVIINPHAFPSRMTIGMFIESMAGKAGALHGFAQDSTPFRFRDEPGFTAVEYFGEQLRAAGFNYHGNEPMYSGITGTEFEADIFLGVVYYQRLRHMVNDKYQVRTTGPIDPVTNQPIKGRKRGGGIRVGEMERDSLIAHGTAFLIHDRLLNCSDYTKSWICRTCGCFIGTLPTVGGYGPIKRGTNIIRCRRCAKEADPWTPKNEMWEDGLGNRFVGGEDTTVVAIPGVLRYLDVELAAMGIKMKFGVSP